MQGDWQYFRQAGICVLISLKWSLHLAVHDRWDTTECVPRSLCSAKLYLTHYPVLSQYPSEGGIYATLWHDQAQPHMAMMLSGIWLTVIIVPVRAQEQVIENNYQSFQTLDCLISANGHLGSIRNDEVQQPLSRCPGRPLLKAHKGHTRCNKPISTATVILDNAAITYGISTYLLTDNKPQVVSKFFLHRSPHVLASILWRRLLAIDEPAAKLCISAEQ